MSRLVIFVIGLICIFGVSNGENLEPYNLKHPLLIKNNIVKFLKALSSKQSSGNDMLREFMKQAKTQQAFLNEQVIDRLVLDKIPNDVRDNLLSSVALLRDQIYNMDVYYERFLRNINDNSALKNVLKDFTVRVNAKKFHDILIGNAGNDINIFSILAHNPQQDGGCVTDSSSLDLIKDLYNIATLFEIKYIIIESHQRGFENLQNENWEIDIGRAIIDNSMTRLLPTHQAAVTAAETSRKVSKECLENKQ